MDEAPLFTGREAETARLLAWIRDPDVRVVLLCGPPACGKTSLWNAGACAALRHADKRAVRVCASGDPAQALRAAAAAEAGAEEPAAAILLDEVDEVLALPTVTEGRARLEEAVLELAAAPRRFALVIELRADLRGELAALEERLGDACRAIVLRPLDDAKLVKALEFAATTGPAFEWEPGVPQRIAADVLAVSDHTGEPPMVLAQLIGHMLFAALSGGRIECAGRIVMTDYEHHVGSASWLLARWLEDRLRRAHHAKRRGIASEMLGALTLARPGGHRVARTLVEEELTCWPDRDVARVVLFNLVMDGLVVRAPDSARYRLVSTALCPVIGGWVLAGDQVERATRVLVESQRAWEGGLYGESRAALEVVARVNARLARVLGERYPTPVAALSWYVRRGWWLHGILATFVLLLFCIIALALGRSNLTVDSPEGATTVAVKGRHDRIGRRLAMPVRSWMASGETQVDVIGAGLITDRRNVVARTGQDVELTAWTPPVRRVWSAHARGAHSLELEDVNADGALDVVLCGDERMCGTMLDGRTGAPLSLSSTRLRFDDLWNWDPDGLDRDRWRTHEIVRPRRNWESDVSADLIGPVHDAVLTLSQRHWGSHLHAVRYRPGDLVTGGIEPVDGTSRAGPIPRTANRKPIVRDNVYGEWRRETDVGIRLTGVAVADLDRDGFHDVVTATESGGVYAIDGRDGTTLWSYRAGGRITGSPVLGDVDDDGMLDAVVLAGDRVEVMTAAVPRIHTAWRGKDLANHATCRLADYDEDGHLDLVQHVRSNAIVRSGRDGSRDTPLLTYTDPVPLPGERGPDVVLVWPNSGPEPSRIMRQNLRSRDYLWERAVELADVELVTTLNPAGPGARFIVRGRNGVAALNADTGATVWWAPASSLPVVSVIAPQTRRPVLVVDEPGAVRSLDPETGREVWAIRRPHARMLGFGLPARPQVVVGTERMALLVDARDGQVAWTAACRRKPLAATVVRSSLDDTYGRACVLEEGGLVSVHSLGSGTVQAEIQAGSGMTGLEAIARSSRALADVVAIGPRELAGLCVRLPQVLWRRVFAEEMAAPPGREDLDADGTDDLVLRAGGSIHVVSGDTGRGLFAVHDLHDGGSWVPRLVAKPGQARRRLLGIQTAHSSVVLELPEKLTPPRSSFPAARPRVLGPVDGRRKAEPCPGACIREVREEDFLPVLKR